MFCPVGLELYEHYANAEKERDAVNARRQSAVVDGPFATARDVQAAKQKYVERFADWLGHKAFCQDCKPKAPAKGEHRSTAPGR